MDKDKKETTSYKIGKLVGQAIVICLALCVMAILVAATVNIIAKLI